MENFSIGIAIAVKMYIACEQPLDGKEAVLIIW